MTKKTTSKPAAKKLSVEQKQVLKKALVTWIPASSLENELRKVGLSGALPKGMTKAVAKTIKIEGLSKKTGRLLKGYRYVKGGNGKIEKIAPAKKM